METALPMLLFFGFLIGFGVLILVCGYQSREQERAEETHPLEDLALQGLPRFFGRPDQPTIVNPVAVVVDESTVQRLEEFLQGEMALAEVFVEAPSVEVLHRPREAEPGVPLFERLESYLRREHEAAASFVSNPSVESLYGQALSPAV